MILASLVATLMLMIGSADAREVCRSPQSANDVLSCLNENHPDIKKAAFDEAHVQGLRTSSRQYANPTLEVESVKGDKLGDVTGETKISLSQVIEIGGKRSARQKLGDASAQALLATSALTREKALTESALTLIRYRQILDEIAVLEEALATYEKVDRQFSARPRLSPDQQVSFSIFKLAIGDYRHKLASLQADRRKLEDFFGAVSDLNFAEAKTRLPRRRAVWPPFSTRNPIGSSPAMKEAEAELIQAEAANELARAARWPDPVVSLVIVREVEATVEWKSYGAALALPLPLWNRNDGERAQAVALKAKADLEFRKRSISSALELKSLAQSYHEFVGALQRSPAPNDIERKHRSTESLFYQGLISGALVIEAHRQILEFTQTQNELELETTRALLQLYAFDGRLQDFKYE